MARTAFASTYVPRRCGIATFTYDLATAVGNHEIVALHPADETGTYPSEVRHRVRRDYLADYLMAARAINADGVGTVSVQHEYGIWGGRDGEYVLDFVRALNKPVISTLHTVLRNPTAHQRQLLVGLIRASAASVVMSRSAAELLTRVYGVQPERLDVIPHGVPELPLVSSDSVKARLGIGGGTHPDLICHEGEAYRDGLKDRAIALGVADQVQFVDRFVGKAELGDWLTAADIFVTPYPNLEQIVSGTLAYAMSAGRAVVSTPYAYATELLGNGRGRLVEPGSPSALARSFVELLGNHDKRLTMGRLAYMYSRSMVWSQVGAQYRRLIERVTTPSVRREVEETDAVAAFGA